jgi:hypothetical protein
MNINSPGLLDAATSARQASRLHDEQRQPRQTGGGSGRQTWLRFAKVVAMYDAAGEAWTDWPTDESYPAYCTAKSCNSAGSNVAAEADRWIGLNTNAESPNGIITEADQIIAYMPGDGAKVYGAVTISGQAAFGFGCWLDYVRVMETA